jgi:hypothetical protein
MAHHYKPFVYDYWFGGASFFVKRSLPRQASPIHPPSGWIEEEANPPKGREQRQLASAAGAATAELVLIFIFFFFIFTVHYTIHFLKASIMDFLLNGLFCNNNLNFAILLSPIRLFIEVLWSYVL